MGSIRQGWNIQKRVVVALMIRELSTRFGRENIGFLWIMLEPMLFAGFVALIWRYMDGPEKHGVGVVAFVVTGYIPIVMFRQSVARSVGLFIANGSLMYHRQIKIYDFIFTRFCVEFIGHTMAFIFIGSVLIQLGEFPVPVDMGYFLLGWFYYSLFTISVCFILAPLSEMSSLLEKLVPVTTYIMIPFSGAFNMVDWVKPTVRPYLLMSPPVNAMEMLRYGVFGDQIRPYFDYVTCPAVSIVLLGIGLMLCRHARRVLVVE